MWPNNVEASANRRQLQMRPIVAFDSSQEAGHLLASLLAVIKGRNRHWLYLRVFGAGKKLWLSPACCCHIRSPESLECFVELILLLENSGSPQCIDNDDLADHFYQGGIQPRFL